METLLRVLGALCFVAFLGAYGWQREKEMDSDGYLCVRFHGVRYALMAVIAFCGVGALWAITKPDAEWETLLVFLAFAGVSGALAMLFSAYMIVLKDGAILVQRPPLPSRVCSLSNLVAIEDKRATVVLRFRNGGPLRISPLLSGKTAFLSQVRALTNASSATRETRAPQA